MDFSKVLPLMGTFLITSWFPMTSQESSFKNEYLKKLKNSLEYTFLVADKMPENKYGFRPSTKQRSFSEQLLHIGEGMAYIGNSGVSFKTVKQPNADNKEAVMAYLKAQYIALQQAIESKDLAFFEETTSFWAGRMTRRKILNIVLDHCTHHRAQAIVCLRMNDIEAPNYIGW